MASSPTAPPVDPALWIFGISDVRNAQRAAPSPPLAADGDVEAVEGLAEASAVDAVGDGLPVGAEAVALPPQAGGQQTDGEHDRTRWTIHVPPG